MNGDQVANILYLSLMGAAIAGWFFMQTRQNLSKTAQQAAVWGLIFVGAVAAAGMWGDIRQQVMPRQAVVAGQTIRLPRAADGHYYLTAAVNGVPVDFVVDTGASEVVLTQQDAARVGIDPQSLRYLGSASTANGTVSTAQVRLNSVAVGDIVDRDVRAAVNGGQMDGSLLGMTYLGLYSKIEISNGTMVLTR